jgi:hypothetical protein
MTTSRHEVGVLKLAQVMTVGGDGSPLFIIITEGVLKSDDESP